MNRERALAIVAAGPRPAHQRYSVRLMLSKTGMHCWVRLHAPREGDLVGRMEVIHRDDFFELRQYDKPQHRKPWWRR